MDVQKDPQLLYDQQHLHKGEGISHTEELTLTNL